MHKKLEAELERLAHSILDLKNNDVTILHKKAHEIYEKLTILKFVEENLNSIHTINKVEEEEKQEVQTAKETIENIVTEESSPVKTIESIIEVTKELEEDVTSIQEKTKDIFIEETPIIKEDISTTKDIIEEIEPPKATLEEEFKDAISADIATNLFEKVTKETPIVENISTEEIKKRSLNDALFNKNIQVGLNDRIAFVKYLFDGSQEDFNRVLSQLNSFTELQEAISFLNDFVKPDYNWQNKEEYENRLMDLIERKFS